ncbi:unnamed protein product [Coffea canephora]|uniref:Uncharacterized protein n=1 Tax=Coffea canephora TaxID=49390 RepID=A0A068TVW0_COFCA|nr:unnamed protein product [Coffea canephora]
MNFAVFPITVKAGCLERREKVQRSPRSLVGSSIASIQKSTAPEMLLLLMDEAYTGSTIGDAEVDSESEDSSTLAGRRGL